MLLLGQCCVMPPFSDSGVIEEQATVEQEISHSLTSAATRIPSSAREARDK
jgi:hypothetical protein